MKQGVDYIGTAIVFMCHDGDGNILFAKRSVNARDENGRWDIGGGALDFGNSVVVTLKKEIKEEYCTDVVDFTFLGYRDVHREHGGRKTHWIALDFYVLVDRAKVAIGEPHQFDEIGWFRLDALPHPTHSQFPQFLANYRSAVS